jgi:hypothetical protein
MADHRRQSLHSEMNDTSMPGCLRRAEEPRQHFTRRLFEDGRSGPYRTQPESHGHRGDAVVHPELGVDAIEVVRHRAFGDGEVLAHGAPAEPICDRPQHLELTRAE